MKLKNAEIIMRVFASHYEELQSHCLDVAARSVDN